MLKLKKPVITRKVGEIINMIIEFLIRIKNSEFRIHRINLQLSVTFFRSCFQKHRHSNKKDNVAKDKLSNQHRKQTEFYITNN